MYGDRRAGPEGPVSRVLYPIGVAVRPGDGHPSRRRLTPTLKQPTRGRGGRFPCPPFGASSFYLALLRVGFDRRRVTTDRPGALTARFHPYLCSPTPKRRGHRRYVSVPLSVAPLSRTMRLGVTQHPAHGARTFLPGCKKQPARPSGPRALLTVGNYKDVRIRGRKLDS